MGVDIFRPEWESESESLEIRRLRSPGQNNDVPIQRLGFPSLRGKTSDD